MDRRHRAFLKYRTAAALVGMAMIVGKLGAQPSPAPAQNTPAAMPSPAGSATPWVQASTPVPSPQAIATVAPTPAAKPTPSATPKPAPTASATPIPAPPKPAGTPASTPKPTVAPPATPGPSAAATDEIKAKMLRQREREMNQTQAFEQQSLSHEEQTTFEKNARLWNRLLPEEQRAILGQAGERIREETEQAYGQTGLNLNDDQREVFALRYRQERRRLERELQEKANNERNRRMPQILEQLKREFGKSSNNNNNAEKPAPTPARSPASSPPGAASNAVPSPTPSPTKA